MAHWPTGSRSPVRGTLLGVLLGVTAGSAQAQSDPAETVWSHRAELLADLNEGSLRLWKQQRLAKRPSRYRVVTEDGRAVLRAESYGGNSGLIRELHLPAERVRAVAWRWRVAAPLDGNRKEREKRGDDFAARVFVIFDAREGPWSGRASRWVDIRRDVLQDFQTAFGAAPDSLTAVAIMVDTDNTGGRATAWFEKLAVELSRSAK